MKILISHLPTHTKQWSIWSFRVKIDICNATNLSSSQNPCGVLASYVWGQIIAVFDAAASSLRCGAQSHVMFSEPFLTHPYLQTLITLSAVMDIVNRNAGLLLVKTGPVTLTRASDWSRLVTWPEYWPLIGCYIEIINCNAVVNWSGVFYNRLPAQMLVFLEYFSFFISISCYLYTYLSM